MRLQTEQKEIDIKYYTNQLKPQLDFIGTYTNTGLAGAPANAVDVGGGGDQPSSHGFKADTSSRYRTCSVRISAPIKSVSA